MIEEEPADKYFRGGNAIPFFGLVALGFLAFIILVVDWVHRCERRARVAGADSVEVRLENRARETLSKLYAGRTFGVACATNTYGMAPSCYAREVTGNVPPMTLECDPEAEGCQIIAGWPDGAAERRP